MLHRSKASLCRLVLSWMAIGLCSLAIQAQQNAATNPPADSGAAAKQTDQKSAGDKPAAPSAEPATGVSNPEPVLPEAAPASPDATASQPSSTPEASSPEQTSNPEQTRPDTNNAEQGSAPPAGALPGSTMRYAPEQPPPPAETDNGPSVKPADLLTTPSTPAAEPTLADAVLKPSTPEATAPAEIPAQQNVPVTPDPVPAVPPAPPVAATENGSAAAAVTQEPAAPSSPVQETPAQQNVPANPDPSASTPAAPGTQQAPATPPANAPAPDPAAPTPGTATPQQPAPANPPAATPAPDSTGAPATPPADSSATPKTDAPAAPTPSAAPPSPADTATPQQTPAPATEQPAPNAPSTSSQTPAPQDASATNPSVPAPQVNEPEPPPASRVDIFGGYAYLRPSGNVGTFSFPNNNTRGYIASGTYYFRRHIGVQAEFSHSEYPLGTTGASPAPPVVQLGGVTDSFYTIEGGPVYRFFLGQHIIPFVHVVGGGAKIAGPKFQPLTWGYGITAGGGVDLLLPHTHDHVAFRLAQADYEYMHADQGALAQYDLAGGSQDVTALRLSAGLVFRFGEMNAALPKSLACDASPAEVYAGERVTLAATLRNYQDKRKTPFVFNWELSAGKQQGFGPVIFVDTTGMAAGTYHATAHIAVKEKGKQFTQCSTNFTVKPSPVPTLKCSADPSTVTPGQTSTITAYANSIAQRQLTYSYTTSEGQINGTDNTAQLHTDGLPPGMATVTCKVKDDLGQTAIATTEVTIAPPELPPAPKAQPLCTVYFNRDMKRPARVDNEGRACLDDVSLTLEHQPDARLVLVGEHSESEADGQLTAAERAINTRAYLANEKGIDPSRVDVRTSTTPGRQVQTFLLAPGAIFDQPTEGRIDETKVHIHGQQYVNQRHSQQKGPVGQGTSHPPKN